MQLTVKSKHAFEHLTLTFDLDLQSQPSRVAQNLESLEKLGSLGGSIFHLGHNVPKKESGSTQGG